MNLLDSLFDAITRLDGDALVLHVGEKPYVVTTSESRHQFRGPLSWGQVELSSRVLTRDALGAMLSQALTPAQLSELDEIGAVHYDVPARENSQYRFTVVAARGGDDVWLEVRRHPVDPVTRQLSEPSHEVPQVPPTAAVADPGEPPAPIAPEPVAAASESASSVETVDVPGMPLHHEGDPLGDHRLVSDHLLVPQDADWTEEVMTEEDLTEILRASSSSGGGPDGDNHPAPSLMQVISGFEIVDTPGDDVEVHEDDDELEVPLDHVVDSGEPRALPPDSPAISASSLPALDGAEGQADSGRGAADAEKGWEGPALSEDGAPRRETVESARRGAPRVRPAVVLPLTRPDRDAVANTRGTATLERLLRLAVGRAAAAVYVVAESAPMVRIDGEFHLLETEPVFNQSLVERLIADADGLRPGDEAAAGDWTIDVDDIGRVHCRTFSDQRGAGVIFRIVPQRAISADQLSLPAEVQALCSEADGLVLVAGGQGSGKSTLLTSFVDLINRTRSDHVITVGPEIGFVHENKRSFISQRKVPGNADALVSAVRTAVREDPDVLVIEELRTPELAALALEAAQNGCLVLASIPAPSTVAAIERVIEMFPPERREKAQSSFAAVLRGVIAQLLLRRLQGGRVAAREILLNTPAVAELILEGRMLQLPGALDGGRRQGMTSFAESLASLVREGSVHASHASRKAPNREQLLALLRRDGIEAGTAERLG